MNRSILAWSLLLLALVAPACSQGTNNIVPRVLNRPAQIALVCFEGSVPVAMERCEGATVNNGFSLYALIPQVARGDVAAIDLTGTQILDSDRRVPGFTFVSAGDIPVAIAIGTDGTGAPHCTFVANRGSRDVVGLQTVRFRDVSLATTSSSREVMPFDSAPQSMVFQDGALWVSFPDEGVVRRIAVGVSASECSFGAVEDIALDLHRVRAPRALVPAEPDTATLAVCNFDVPLAPVGAIEAPEYDPMLVADPAPWEIEAAPDIGRIFVGDARVGRIYPIQTGGGVVDRVGAAVVTDAPVLDMALTPAVPTSMGGPEARYLYAIDANDGSIMAMDFTDEASDTYGALLAVNVEGLRAGRLAITTPARVLSIIDSDAAEGVCDIDAGREPNVGASILRGVFLGVGATDGTFRFFDVYDRDATCRGAPVPRPNPDDDACTRMLNAADGLVYIRRHRPRVGQSLTATVQLVDEPNVTIEDGASGPFTTDGASSFGLSFAPLAGCAAGLGPLFFADTAAPFVCGVTDPWAARSEQWSLDYEGVIPGTTGVGNLSTSMAGDEVYLDVVGDYCSRGVIGSLGAARTPEGEPEHGYAGDYLVITSGLPEVTSSDETCRALFGLTAEQTSTQPVYVPITDVRSRAEGEVVEGLPDDPFRTRIVISADTLVRGTDIPFGRALDCFADELVDFEIRMRDALVVSATRSGFQHRVIAERDAAGGGSRSCIVDTSRPRREIGIAFEGRAFVGSRLQFTLVGVTPEQSPTVRLSLSGVPRPLAVDVGFVCTRSSTTSLPADALFSAVDQRLYILDEVRRGLVVLDVPALTLARCYE